MLAKRLIPCLDVKEGKVVKGVKFKNHQVMGNIVELAKYYSESGADELVFYDITASSEGRVVDTNWISEIAKAINIPFCVAGGIRNLKQAEAVLNAGADKISINSPALENPNLIDELAAVFGQQCIVIGIDSKRIRNELTVCQYTGSESTTQVTILNTLDWVKEVQGRGAGEIVLNCMDSDGVKKGYDITQLKAVREVCEVPLIASGGAGEPSHFLEVFQVANVDGALAASVFHTKKIELGALKTYLLENEISIRPLV